MAPISESLEFEVYSKIHKAPDHIRITIHQKVVKSLYKHALKLLKKENSIIGFQQDHAPQIYLDEYYREHVLNHLKEFLLKYSVISFLYKNVREKKIIMIGDPRLDNIIINLGQNAEYHFDFTPAPPVPVRDWRYLPFKPPLRKKYKDIDKQATNFITEERTLKSNLGKNSDISTGDWILFSASLLNENKKPLFNNLQEYLWLRISDEETGEPFNTLFIERKKGDQFNSTNQCLCEYFGSQLNIPYLFQISILEVLPHTYFCLDSFKEQFRLKSDRKTHQKIVEVYSFRNDLSLRRAMVEETYKVLSRTFPIDVPQSAITRQERIIRDELQLNPDYSVYKLQSTFSDTIKSLAEKQMRTTLLTDYFSQQENITIDAKDVYNYLNLTKRPRTKEFIHFLHPSICVNEDEAPIPYESLKHTCIKEKTMNHILYHLTK